MLFKNAQLHNVVELIEADDGVGYRMLRIPYNLKEKLIRVNERNTAFYGCGTEVRFNMIGDEVKVTLGLNPDLSGFGTNIQVYYGSIPSATLELKEVSDGIIKITVKKSDKIEVLRKISKGNDYPFDADLIRILLPSKEVHLIDIEGEVNPPRKEQLPSTRYLAYGSSITHGSNAVTPSNMYAMRTAAALNADLTNLGFAGSAHLEVEIADYILNFNDWDFATLEMGINLYHLSVEDFKERAEAFIKRFAEFNGEKYIFCIDLFMCEADITGGDSKISEFRSIIKNAVENSKNPKLIYIKGTDLLTTPQGLTADILHPNIIGHEEISRNLVNIIKKYV